MISTEIFQLFVLDVFMKFDVQQLPDEISTAFCNICLF